MVPCALLFPVHRRISSSVLKNVNAHPPPNPYIPETAFSHRFQKVYTYPANGTKFWRIRPKVQKPQEKCQNPHSECPREMCHVTDVNYQHGSADHIATPLSGNTMGCKDVRDLFREVQLPVTALQPLLKSLFAPLSLKRMLGRTTRIT